MPRSDRNLLLFVFADPRARTLFGDGWATMARATLAQFRSTQDL